MLVCVCGWVLEENIYMKEVLVYIYLKYLYERSILYERNIALECLLAGGLLCRALGSQFMFCIAVS